MNCFIFLCLLSLVFGDLHESFHPASVDVIEFDEKGTLFVGDTFSATIHAYRPGAGDAEVSSEGRQSAYNLMRLGPMLAHFLGTTQDKLIIRDLAVHPLTNKAYIAIHKVEEESYFPMIVSTDQSSTFILMDLYAKHTSYRFFDTPKSEYFFFDSVALSTLTFTDIEIHKDLVYISGISKQSSVSSIRVLSYPFDGNHETTTVEIYNPSHGAVETRAPIRSMKIVTFADQKDYIVAVYTATPLVLIPLEELKGGANIRGKTIAELGYGNTPTNLLHFQAEDADDNRFPVIYVSNIQRSSVAIPLSDIEEAGEKAGLKEWVKGGRAGPTGLDVPISGTMRTVEQDPLHLVSLRREHVSGDLQLVSHIKSLYFRISDLQIEQSFPGFTFESSPQQDFIKKLHDTLMRDEGFSRR